MSSRLAISGLRKLFKYLSTRNVRFQSKGLPKGMGQTRQGTVKTVKNKSWSDPMTIPRANQAMGGGKIFTPTGGGKRGFLPKSAKVGPTRGTKIAATGTPAVVAGGVATSQYNKKPTGPATAGQKQFSAVRSKPGGLRNPAWKGDVASYSKSGYHKFKQGSKTAKAFSAAFKAAAKAGKKQFTWGVTGKKYAVSYK